MNPALVLLIEELAAELGEAVIEEIFDSVRVPLSSSALSSAEYEVTSGDLTIDFTDGDSHTYSGVSPATFVALCTAGSPGSYFNANIRNAY
jgi:hypothetical protein